MRVISRRKCFGALYRGFPVADKNDAAQQKNLRRASDFAGCERLDGKRMDVGVHHVSESIENESMAAEARFAFESV